MIEKKFPQAGTLNSDFSQSEEGRRKVSALKTQLQLTKKAISQKEKILKDIWPQVEACMMRFVD